MNKFIFELQRFDGTLISGTDDDDEISNTLDSATINAGDGDDTIVNDGNNVLINGGAGDDTINNQINGEAVTINAGGGDDSIYNDGSNISIDGGASDDSISNSGNFVTITGGEGNDSIQNYNSNVTINGGAGNDEVHNHSENVIINGDAGDDFLCNYADKNSVNGGAGNDHIYNSSASVSINGGDGEDNIENYGSTGVTLDGGDGDDLIRNYNVAKNVTIKGGKGNDNIYNEAKKVTFEYHTGDGYDTISGFNETSTLQIGDGTGSYSTLINNSDVIVFAGDAWIVLGDAASLSTINISGTKSDGNPTIKGTDGADSIDNKFSDVIINGGSGNDTLINGWKDDQGVWHDGGSKVTINAGYGNDTIENYGSTVTINAGAGNDYIKTYRDLVSVSGGAGNDSIINVGYSVTIDGDLGDDYIDNTVNNVTIRGGEGNDYILNRYASNVTINSGAGNDTIYNSYSKNVLFQYAVGDGNDVIYSFDENDTLQIGDGAKDTYSTHLSGDNVIVSVGEGQITLAGAANLSALNIQGKEIILEPIWNISGTTATYGTTAETLITVNGVKSKDGLSVKNKVVTVAASSLNKDTITISNGYTLKLADDVTTPQPTAAHWEHSGITATYKNDYTSAGYSISNKQIVYNEATGGETLITVKGVKSLDGVSLKDGVVTIADSSLNKGTVTISDGYTLALGSDVTKSVTTKEGWTFGSSKALYKSEHISTGYKLSNNQISYLTESGGATLITVSGVKNSDGVSLDKTKKVVTVAETSLGTGKVTVSEDYTLKLGNDVTKTEQKKVWSFDGETVATYKDATIAGYSVAADEKSIDYTKAASKTLATVTGVKSAYGLSVSGDTITVSKKSLGTDKVTVSDGYKLALAPEVDNPVTTAATWTMSGTTAIYKSSSTTAGYTLADNAITYSKAKAATTLAQIDGAKTVKGISISDTIIKAAATALANDISVSGGDYEFNFDAKYTKAKISGTAYDEFIKSAGKYITIDSGKGDDTIISNGSNMSISASGGNNYIQLAAKTSDQTVQTGAGFDTVESNAQRALIATKGGSDYITNAGANASISAGDGNDTIINSGSNVTLNGGKGNDLLTGGKGADIFVYALGDGNDTITDYTADDIISVASGEVSFATKGKDVILTVSKAKKKGTVTIKNAVGTVITYVDADGNEQTYPEIGLDKNAGGTAVTLRADYEDDTFDVTSNAYVASYASKIVSIDAAAVNQAIAITGNKKDNVIIGGQSNDTLAGGKGNDSLLGGAGADVFLWNKGDADDTILDYTEDDTINISGSTVKKIATSKDKKDLILTLASKNKITLKNSADKVINYTDDNGENSYSQFVKFNDAGTGATLKSTYVKDDFNIANYGGYEDDVVTINAAAVEQDIVITANKKNNVVTGGAGNDTIYGGKGNDSLTGKAGADVFIWNKGDGNDVITDYAEDDEISIKGSTVKKIATSKDKKDLILTLASKNKITIKGGADKVINYIDDSGENSYSQFVKFNDAGTGATLKSTYVKDDFNIANYGGYEDDVVTINAAAVEQDLVITGNKKNNVVTGGQGNDTISGGKGNDSLAGGVGADVFVWNKGDGNDVITDYAEDDEISITGSTVKKISTSKDKKDLILTLASKNKITIKGGADKVINYSDDSGENSYSQFVKFNDVGTGATLKSTYVKDDFNIANYGGYEDDVVTINAAAVEQDLVITANKKNNVVTGGQGNDTIYGGKGNDKLYGGEGDDVFVWNTGDGNDTILDYDEDDTIQIASGTIKSVKKSGKNVIFTVGSNKISVVGGASKAVSYIDKDGNINCYPTPPASSVVLEDSGATAIIRETYTKRTFLVSDYSNSIKKIDASAVTHDISITGNGKANVILGGYEDDTIYGGKGNDTLQGGTGADIFFYANGDGKDVIVDYAEEDTIQITSGKIKNITTKNSDVIFTIGSGKISVLGAAGQTVSYIDASGQQKIYGDSASNVLEDDNFITGNDVSSIVQSNSTDYFVAALETPLTSAKTLPTVTYSSKK